MCSMCACIYIYIYWVIFKIFKLARIDYGNIFLKKSPFRNCGSTDLLQPRLRITINLDYGLTIIHIEKFELELCIFENKITQKYLFIRFIETVFLQSFSLLFFQEIPSLYQFPPFYIRVQIFCPIFPVPLYTPPIKACHMFT